MCVVYIHCSFEYLNICGDDAFSDGFAMEWIETRVITFNANNWLKIIDSN